MPTALCDGIETRYRVTGTGLPVLMWSPGGFDSRLENWSTLGVYRRTGLIDRLAKDFTCITFDRRESGESGGRLERLTWDAFVAQGVGVLDAVGVDRAFVMGGCVGCSTALALAVAHPDRVLGAVLYSPAGGPRYRITQHARFAEHLAYVREHGLDAVVELARSTDSSFSTDPRLGPWVTVLRRDQRFATSYARCDTDQYELLVLATVRGLFDRDTVPGAEPEDLMRLSLPALIVPGQDRSHAPSAARYLQECLTDAQYWDVPVDQQTADNAPARVAAFLADLS